MHHKPYATRYAYGRAFLKTAYFSSPAGRLLLQTNEHNLTSLNTLGLQSHVAALVRYRSTDDLPQLSELASRHGRVFVLGGGSNVVLAPEVKSLVIKVESRGIRLVSQTEYEWIVEAQAGENWHQFVNGGLDEGWSGLENLALIPGTVGAAPVQNIGAYGLELDQRFHSLLAWDLHRARRVEMSAEDCQFSYRDSFFKRAEPGRWLITAVRFRLPKTWQPRLGYPDLQHHPVLSAAGASVTPRQVFDAVCEIRRRKLPDPAVIGNAGSFFKNPIVDAAHYESIKRRHPEAVAYPQDGGASFKLAAGWLIDRAGWKGRRMGAVGVHDRQALVLVNHGGANAGDLAVLAKAIADDIADRFGVRLEQEPVPVY